MPCFQLYSGCVPVKGAKRSIVCNLENQEYIYIPNSMYDVLKEYANCDFDQLKADFDDESHVELDKHFGFLIEKGLGFWTDHPEEFPDMALDWDCSALISNAIIDIDEYSNYNIIEVVRQLNTIGCEAIQFRFFTVVDAETIDQILAPTVDSDFMSVELNLKYDISYSEEFIKGVCDSYKRLQVVFVHSSPEEKICSTDQDYFHIEYKQKEVKDESHCGNLGMQYFRVNIPLFTESHHFNNCLNRKISVDKQGNIKNCPSMSTSYGHISNTNLQQALNQQGFKDTWSIKKQDIEVCKDCEFRYICTDCRAYTANPENKYAKPAKCSYDPYAAKWN